MNNTQQEEEEEKERRYTNVRKCAEKEKYCVGDFLINR